MIDHVDTSIYTLAELRTMTRPFMVRGTIKRRTKADTAQQESKQ